MRAHHLFFPQSGSVELPRKKTRLVGTVLPMKSRTDSVLSRMAKTSLFGNLSAAECRVLLKKLDVRVRSYACNELILHECDSATDIVVVLKGSVCVYECGFKTDHRHLVCWLRPGDVYGATFPVLNLKMNPGMLVAHEPVETLVCSVMGIRDVIRMGLHAAFVANLYAAVARQGYAAWRKLSILGCYEIADRLRLYIRQRAEDGMSDSPRLNLAELAEYLGVNRTALYRALNKLQKRKL